MLTTNLRREGRVVKIEERSGQEKEEEEEEELEKASCSGTKGEQFERSARSE